MASYILSASLVSRVCAFFRSGRWLFLIGGLAPGTLSCAPQSGLVSQELEPVAALPEDSLPRNGNVGFYGVGGGWLEAGLLGRYFADPEFSDLRFERRDIRIDFDWGETVRPGGNLPWTRIGNLGADHYSIRWEGQFIPRFSEVYEWVADGDSLRLWVKPEGRAAWGDPLLENWGETDKPEDVVTAKQDLVAGEVYDVRLEYRERAGSAKMRLRWRSASTPLEVIQSTAMVGIKPPETGVILADAVRSATNWRATNRRAGELEYDAQGWPTSDFQFVLRPIDRDVQHGTYFVQYRGSSALRIHLNEAEIFSADGSESFGTQKGPLDGYDPVTNTTAVRVRIAHDRGNCWPRFTDTDRDGPGGTAYGTGTGVTEIRMMMPLTPGSEEWHPLDEVFHRDAVDAFSDTFVTLRWNDVNGAVDYGNVRTGEPSGRWEDRMPFDYRNQNMRNPDGRVVRYTNENHEYKILLHNRIGKDPYLQIPHFATDDYIRKLALLVKYGGNEEGEPYSGPAADPYFPPLNPNLRVNLEFSNEVPWNAAGQYPQSNWMRAEPERLRQAWLEDPESRDGKRFAILNYDGAFDASEDVSGFGIAKRFYGLRTVEMSNIFREVFGDEDMPAPGKNDPRIRPLLMYQYDNTNNTARDSLFFIDNTFNTTDPKSPFAGEPQPPNYYIYGGGAATYYASENAIGLDESHPLTREIGTFEEPRIRDGMAALRPNEQFPWDFEGTAGVVAWPDREAGTFGEIPEAVKGLDGRSMRGFKMTVGPEDVAVYEIGRYVHSGNRSYPMSILDAEDGTTIMSYALSTRGLYEGDTAWTRTGQSIFVMAGKSYNWPVILRAGKSYYVVAQEDENAPYAPETAITPPPGVRIDGAVAIETKRRGWSHEFVSAEVGNTPNRTFGPVNIKIATGPVVAHGGGESLELGYLQESRNGLNNRSQSLEEKYISRQALFLAGKGSAATEITIPEPGIYALVYSVAHKPDQTPWDGIPRDEQTVNPIRIFADPGDGEQPISPSSQADPRPNTGSTHNSGYWAKTEVGFDFFGTAPFETTVPDQRVRIRFAGTGERTDQVVQIDDIGLASSAIMTAGQIPGGGGFAEGAPDVSNWEARVMSMYRYAQTFGIKAVSYEGGWYPGGDANKMPLQFQSSFFDPRMVTGEKNAIRALARAGLTLNTDFTFGFALPDYALGHADRYSRIRAWRELNRELPAEATNGLPLLSTLTHTSTFWSNKAEGARLEAGGWMSWNVVAPESGTYRFSVTTTEGGAIDVKANEAVTLVSGATGGKLRNQEGIFLTKGLHSIRARALEGAFELTGISCSLPGQPYGSPGLEGQSAYRSVLLKWPEVSGADGYNVYYKTRTESGWRRYNDAPLQTGGEFYRVKDLEPDVTHNFVTTYIVDGEESAYSNQITAVPLIEADLAAWRFDDATGRGISPATQQDILLQPTEIEMVGLPPSSSGHMSKQAMGVDGMYRENDFILPEPDPGQYYGLTLAPVEGARMKLDRVEFGVWASRPATKDPREQVGFRAQLRWSTDGFATSQAAPMSPETPVRGWSNGNPNSGERFTADLSGFPGLRDLQQPVEFRIYVYGELGFYHGIGKRGDAWDVVVIGGVLEE